MIMKITRHPDSSVFYPGEGNPWRPFELEELNSTEDCQPNKTDLLRCNCIPSTDANGIVFALRCFREMRVGDANVSSLPKLRALLRVSHTFLTKMHRAVTIVLLGPRLTARFKRVGVHARTCAASHTGW
jgi:hypothetical protein